MSTEIEAGDTPNREGMEARRESGKVERRALMFKEEKRN